MSIIDIAAKIFHSSFILVIELSLILIGVMILIEFLQAYKVLDRLTALAAPITRLLKMPREGNLPLLAGLLLGISYGAAVIIEAGQNGSLDTDDIFLANLFLVICHGLIEETLIWSAVGAKVLPIQLARIIVAVGVCYVASLFVRKNKNIPLSRTAV
ncbi:MAG: nucleoside recognition protein [Bacillota bacterium]|nr:nucleoside recognition protein [Bacillota bacterium]